MTLSATERNYLNKRSTLLNDEECKIIDQAFADMNFRAGAAGMPLLLQDDNLAKLEAAFIRYLLACRGVDTATPEQGFPALDIDKVLWKDKPMHIRAKNERKVVYALLSQIIAAGFNIVDVDDGQELTQITHNMGDSIKAAMEIMFNLDDCVVYVHKDGKQHYISFVFGNADDGSEVIADWSYTDGDPDGFNKLMAEFSPESHV